MTVVLMSKAELSRVDTLARVDRGELPVAGAASLLGLSPRQVFRLLARFRAEGASGLASRRRGRPSNRRLPTSVREAALAVVRERYADFGPTLAAEKLAELHDIRLSRETLRQWMAEAGLWVPRKARRGRVHQPRHRRDRLGELVQIDGCQHHWFEDRGPPCTLLVFVDDATSRLMHLQFVPAESAFAYMAATRSLHRDARQAGRLLLRQARRLPRQPPGRGRRRRHDPVRAGAARADHRHHLRQQPAGEGPGRAGAQDPPGPAREGAAAGRASAPFEAANAFLPAFVADYNARFAKERRPPRTCTGRLAPHDDLDEALTWREERTVTGSLTLHYDKVLFLLEPSDVGTRASPASG